MDILTMTDNDNGQTLFFNGIDLDTIVDNGKYDESYVSRIWLIFTMELPQ